MSNRHLSLGPILRRLADAHHLVAIEQQQDVTLDEARVGKSASDWVILARTQGDLGALANDPRWQGRPVPEATPVWTDDFSNILSALKREP